MRKLILSIVAITILFCSGSFAQGTYTSNLSGGSGNWSAGGTWVCAGGTCVSATPTAGDAVIIGTGDDVSVDITTPVIGLLTINGGSLERIRVAATRTLNATSVSIASGGTLATLSTGNITVTGAITSSGTIQMAGSGTISAGSYSIAAGGLTFSLTATGTISSSGAIVATGGAISTTVGAISAASMSIGASSSLTLSGASTLNVVGLINAAGTFSTNTASTITCGSLNIASGTTSGALTVNNGDLTVTGSPLFNSQNVNVTNGNFVVSSGTPTTSGNTVTVGATTGGVLDVTGGIIVSSGAVFSCKSISLKSGSNSTFGGTINVNNGAWTNTGTVTLSIGGNVNNVGALTTSSLTTITFAQNAASISAASIDLSAGGNLNCSGFAPTITVTGNFTAKDENSVSNVGTSKLVCNGNTVIDGGTVAGATFYNITVNTGSAATILNTVNLSGSLTLNGTGTFDADGTANAAVFKLIYNASTKQTGRIETLGTPANFTGKVTIERFIPHDSYWQYLSFPVTNMTVNDLQSAFPVTGLFASGASGTGGPVTDSNAESMFYWDGSTQAFQNYGVGKAGSPATSSAALLNTVGYTAYAYGTTSSKILMTGKTISSGAVPVSLSNGFNLIPNPYPSAIDFNSFKARTGTLGGTVYLQADGGGPGNVYASSDGVSACTNCNVTAFTNTGWLGEIDMGQSFWVSSTGSATLTFQESDKTATAAIFAGKTEAPKDYIRISLVSGDMRDETIINFKEEGSLTYNSKLDALKHKNGFEVSALANSYINISTIKGDNKTDLVFNYMPLLDCSTGSSVVGLNAAVVEAGTHSLKFSDLETFNLGYKITLNDKFLNTTTTIVNGLEYKFSTTDNPSTFGSGRFELKFESKIPTTPSISVAGTKLTSSYKSNNQWYKNDKEIVGATMPTFEVTESGSYTVKTIIGACKLESVPSVLTITGIEDINSLVSIYPNPTSNFVTVSLPADMTVRDMNIIDAKGVKLSSGLLSSTNENSDIKIDLEGLPVGLYILKVTTDAKVLSFKILKK